MSRNLTRIVDVLVDLMDVLLDFMAVIRDHFVIGRHVTLSEGMLLALAAVRAVWFTIFGARLNEGLGSPLTHEAWTVIFWVIVCSHVVSFFIDDRRPRIVVLFAYAFVWMLLAILTFMVAVNSPIAPTFLLFGLAATFILVRMLRERKHGPTGSSGSFSGT